MSRATMQPLAGLKDWRFEIDFEDLAWAVFDREGERVNTLGTRAFEELGKIIDHVETAARDGVGAAGRGVRGLIIISAKRTSFISGADIREFDGYASEADVEDAVRRGIALFDRIEALRVPVVAAIHGHCLGGGLELAMACHYRIADREDATRIGLPEVKLGIFPGLNGTVRSIRLAGPLAAMEAMLTGRMLRPTAARAMGFVDQLVPSRHNLRWAARRAALQKRKSKGASTWKRALTVAPVRALLARQMRKKTAAKVRKDHYPAPFALIDLFEKHGGDPKRMKRAETEAFAPLMVSETARNLRRVFFLSERLKGQAPKDGPQPRRVHVIGAGTMGADIAAWCVVSGMEASLQDLSEEALEKAQARAKKLFQRRLRKPVAVEAAMARLVLDAKGDHVPRADVVIEAIVENLEVKQKVFANLEPRLKEGALLASNTSSLPIEDIAARLAAPERLIGLHFFNPVPQLPLVEVVRSPLSREEVVARGAAFVAAINKFPLVTKSTPGFLVNRVLAPYMMGAMARFDEGTERELIDEAARTFGMPMGPLELADQVGLDICAHVGEILGLEKGVGEHSALKRMVAAGDLGRKTGKGFYEWKDGKPQKEAKEYDPEELAELGEALVAPLIDECEKCVAEGVVADADLADAGVIFGTGFAPFRGGPLHYRKSQQAQTGEARSAAA